MNTQITNTDTKLISNKYTYIDNLVKLAPIFTAAILSISITYDSAYLWALGLNLNDIPSSITEHIRSAILWFPIVCIIFILLSASFVIEDNTPKTSSTNSIFRKIKFFTILFIYILTILMLIYLIFKYQVYSGVFVLFTYFWMGLLVYFFYKTEKYKTTKKPITFMILFIPIILSLFGFAGYFQGSRILNSNTEKWEYTIKKDDKEISLKINGQRRFTEFTIAILSNKKILIIQNSNIVSMKSL